MRIIRVRALIEHEGKLLFVQHHHHAADTWALAGGRVDDGEQLQDALHRELVEELGVAPVIGAVRYIHQLFLSDGNESLEFFFEVNNGVDYTHLDLNSTSHGELELRVVDFINPSEHTVLPEFLVDYEQDKAANNWPIFRVRSADGI